jgi:hypothetical protein
MEILQTRRGNSDDTIKAMKKAVLMGLNNPRTQKIIYKIPNGSYFPTVIQGRDRKLC